MIEQRHRFREHLRALELELGAAAAQVAEPAPDLADDAAGVVAAGYAAIRDGLAALGLALEGPIRITADGDLEGDELVIHDDLELRPEDPAAVVEALRLRLLEREVRVADVARAIGRSAGALYAWLAGRRLPSRASTLALIAFLTAS